MQSPGFAVIFHAFAHTFPLSSHTRPSNMPFLKSSLTAPRPYRLDAAFSVIPQDPADLANIVLASPLTTGRQKKYIITHFVYLGPYVEDYSILSSNPGPRLHLQAYQVLYSLQTHHALVILAFYFSNIKASFQLRGFALLVPSAWNVFPSELHYSLILTL